MSNGLIQELKDRLKIEELVARSGLKLTRSGRSFKACCPFHNENTASFYVRPSSGCFRCYGCGKSGDVISWLTFEKFKRLDVDGGDFVEVLKYGCECAGVAFPERAGAPGSKAKGSDKRRREAILEKYVVAAEAARTAEFYVRARQIGRKVEEVNGERVEIPGKVYLTEDACKRWRLGFAPTLKQCLDGGITEDELRDVGLLRPYYGDERLFYQDSIIIPILEHGRIVSLIDRKLNDNTERKKCFLMPGPNEDGTGGMPPVSGFNVDVA